MGIPQITRNTYFALLAAGHFIPEVAEGAADFCYTFTSRDTAALFRYAKKKKQQVKVAFILFFSFPKHLLNGSFKRINAFISQYSLGALWYFTREGKVKTKCQSTHFEINVKEFSYLF